MGQTITCLAPAKINLYLEISSKRADGYHNIESVMQTVTLFDKLTFTKNQASNGKKISLLCTDGAIPCDGRNLVWRAAELLFDTAGVECYDICISLEKHIPSAAGLGGGSSDAAATLTALNELYRLGLSSDTLRAIGGRLGADIPFLVEGGIAVTRGIGDEIFPCKKMPDCYIAVACAGEGVSTPWAYKKLDEKYDFSSRSVGCDKIVAAIEAGNIGGICREMSNIFESVVLRERETARRIIDKFNECGAIRSMMSGSGPSVIGVFDTMDGVLFAKEKLAGEGIDVHLTKPYYKAAK